MANLSNILLMFNVLLPAMVLSEMVCRKDWGARPPKEIERFKGPSRYVIIHHSYIPGACYTTEECKAAMRSMQAFHQDDREWNDIGYSFAVGGDAKVYYGRGFNVVGAHAPKYNDKSVGICIIGDWRTELPSKEVLKATKEFIRYGIEAGYIAKDYQLLGHRQVRETECPGDRLFQEIQKWDHFTPTPEIGNFKTVQNTKNNQFSVSEDNLVFNEVNNDNNRRK